MNVEQFLYKIPKVDLHIHLSGCLQIETLFNLAKKNNVNLPTWDPRKIYKFKDFYDFLIVLECVSLCMVDKGDFSRVAYEAVTGPCISSNLRYTELFFNPQFHYKNGIDYKTMVDGYIEGLDAAEKEYGVVGKLIPSINRELGPEAALNMVQDVVRYPRERVIGLGMDCAEHKGKPHLFADSYALAKKAGLYCTAHVCEDNQTLEQAPPSHVLDCIDLLGCDRLDHGYNMLIDSSVVNYCKERDIPITVASHTSVSARMGKRWDSIGKMRQIGLNIILSTDDPQMFSIDIGKSYTTALERLNLSLEELVNLSLNSIDASWLPGDEKRHLRRMFELELSGLEYPGA